MTRTIGPCFPSRPSDPGLPVRPYANRYVKLIKKCIEHSFKKANGLKYIYYILLNSLPDFQGFQVLRVFPNHQSFPSVQAFQVVLDYLESPKDKLHDINTSNIHTCCSWIQRIDSYLLAGLSISSWETSITRCSLMMFRMHEYMFSYRNFYYFYAMQLTRSPIDPIDPGGPCSPRTP